MIAVAELIVRRRANWDGFANLARDGELSPAKLGEPEPAPALRGIGRSKHSEARRCTLSARHFIKPVPVPQLVCNPCGHSLRASPDFFHPPAVSTYSLSGLGYLKLLAHAAKHPASTVIGILVGTASQSAVTIEDCIPLVHHWTALAVAVEAGLQLVRPPHPPCLRRLTSADVNCRTG